MDMKRTLAKVILDSVSPNGVRLTTLEVVFPRIVLAEFNTHRVFSRNSASSRAIPVKKMLERVQVDPYVPETWGKNRSGMQATEALSPSEAVNARDAWLDARDDAVKHVQRLLDIGVHKQTTNRILEPWLWHTCIVTATEWANFRHLRTHTDAHPAIQNTARAIALVLDESKPTTLRFGEWHTPFIRDDDDADLDTDQRCKVSIARCARVSYLTHDGRRDVKADLGLFDRLRNAGHMSPFEHVAMPTGDFEYRDRFDFGNFAPPWLQWRKTIPGEADILAPPTSREEGAPAT